ncbi:hypothetical protein IQ06DRAFT_307337 [Phaeosphaeriaceae sp. SRC1lsM3a]|nr:hypothetical protein IQ06DRAFT_307337 [Stagonospora sp. SRC1lsM3a]
MRQLISLHPTSLAALIKPTFTTSEIEIYTHNMPANELAPVHLTPKYVAEPIFGLQARQGQVRVLVDGFPRNAAQLRWFVDTVKEKWRPGSGAVVLVLRVDQEVARKRHERRPRAGDEFKKRFDEHEENIGAIVDAMRWDGMVLIEVDANQDMSTEDLIRSLEQKSEWNMVVGGGVCAADHIECFSER